MNRDDRAETDSSLERSCPGACPGGLVQVSDPHLLRIPTPVEHDHLEISDDLEPIPHFVGNWVPLVGDQPGAPVITTDGEQLFVLDIYTRAGIANRLKCRTRHLPREAALQRATPNFINNIFAPEDSVGRGSRARSDFIKLARSNDLNIFVTLSYVDQEDDLHRYPSACDDMFTLFIRRIRKYVGSFSWLEVLEYGDESYRLHHHALLPESIGEQVISEKWNFGTTVVKPLPDTEAIGKTASYMSKHFLDPEPMRPRRNRYRAGRRLYREKPIRVIGTWDDIELELRSRIPEGSDLEPWASQHPYSSGGYTWNRLVEPS